MKQWIIYLMVLAAATVHAAETDDETMDEAALEVEFQRLKAAAEALSVPTVCADLTATPTPLPNGDVQYPTRPCKPLDLMIPPDPVEPVAAPKAMPQAPAMSATPVPRPAVMPPAVPQAAPAQDLNALQMKRLGQLDAMQGRPINMQNANNLGYLQGYTDGQKMRMRAPGGGFGGYNR